MANQFAVHFKHFVPPYLDPITGPFTHPGDFS